MQFPANLPANVRKGVELYVRLRRAVALCALAAFGVAGVAFLLSAFLLLDRFVELSPSVRGVGPSGITGGLLLLVLGFFFLWRWIRPDALEVAIHLDKAVPQHQDRWGTALDLARREAAGEQVGPATLLTRLRQETEEKTSLAPVAATVRRRALGAGLVCLCSMVLWFGFLQWSSAFDLTLLWQRFWQPQANLPRDSFTVIRFLETNGRPWTDGELPALPEDSNFTLTIALERKTTWLAELGMAGSGFQAPPQVEYQTATGVEVRECRRQGERWQFRAVRLGEPLRFRVRADDALSAWWQQPVTPRIKLSGVTHTLWFPKYARRKNVIQQELTAKRLSVLSGTRMEFEVRCSEPHEGIEATFEILQKKGDAGGQGLFGQHLLKIGQPGAKQEKEDVRRRELTVRRRGAAGGRFRLLADDSGILRLRARGKNGLYSREWLCMIEALPDAPPKVTMTGLESETTIVPGETVAYQFAVEDDYAVSDLIMSWTVAGGAAVTELTGEEYIHHPDYGKRQLGGQELIQRMDYRVYSTEPFEFRLVAVDSKGQETRTAKYRIHIVSDDFSARFQRGMEYLNLVKSAAESYLSYHRNLANQLNIIAATVGQSKTWPPAQGQLLAEYTKSTHRQPDVFGLARYYHQRYGGFPYRLNRAAILLALPHQVLPRYGDLLPLVEQLPQSQDVPVVLAQLQQAHERGQAFAQIWLAAVRAETLRFLPEHLLHKARKLDTQLHSLAGLKHNQDLYAANLRFYLDELAALFAAADELPNPSPELKRVLVDLRAAHRARDVAAVAQHLSGFTSQLAARMSSPSAASVRLVEALAEEAQRDEGTRSRFLGAHGEVMRARGQESLFRPLELLHFGLVTEAGNMAPGNWYAPPGSLVDLWLALDQLHQRLRSHQLDLLCGRYELFAAAADDREAALREELLVVWEMVAGMPELSEEKRGQLVQVFSSAVRGDLHAVLRREDSALLTALDQAVEELPGLAAIAKWQGSLAQHVGFLRTSLRQTAEAFAAYGPRCQALASQPEIFEEIAGKAIHSRLYREAEALKQRVEGLEAYTRAVLFLLAQERLHRGAQPGDWPAWQPLHGLQLAMTMVASQSAEKVLNRYGREGRETEELIKTYGLIADGSRDVAEELRRCADLTAAVLQGKEVTYDFEALMKRTRTEGYLEHLHEEFEYISSFLDVPGKPVDAAAQEQLAGSIFGKIARHEGRLVHLVRATSQLDQGLQEGAAGVLQGLRAVATAVAGAEEEEDLRQQLQALERMLRSLPIGKDVLQRPEVQRRLSAVREELSETTGRLAAAVHLPRVKATAQLNRRFTKSRNSINLWTIQGIVDGHDRRWAEELRHAELSLVRELAARVFAEVGPPAHAQSLELQYGRILELRARNLANERRRNRGLSFLAEDSGPSLRLPKHIATEFFKARNRRSPAAFKARIKAYYEALYQDLAE